MTPFILGAHPIVSSNHFNIWNSRFKIHFTGVPPLDSLALKAPIHPWHKTLIIYQQCSKPALFCSHKSLKKLYHIVFRNVNIFPLSHVLSISKRKFTKCNYATTTWNVDIVVHRRSRAHKKFLQKKTSGNIFNIS